MGVFSDNLSHLSFPNAASDCCVFFILMWYLNYNSFLSLWNYQIQTVSVENDEEKKMIIVHSFMDVLVCRCRLCSFLKLCLLCLTSVLYLLICTLNPSIFWHLHEGPPQMFAAVLWYKLSPSISQEIYFSWS